MEFEEQIKYALTENFIFFVDILKDPKYVFGTETREFRLADAWLDKLTTLETYTLAEIRLRNEYMSHLLACLISGKLTGPFITLPPYGPLEATAFGGGRAQSGAHVCPPPQEPSSRTVCAPTPDESCECKYVCCDREEELAELCPQPEEENKSKTPNDNYCGYLATPKNVQLPSNDNVCIEEVEESKSGASSVFGQRMGAAGSCDEGVKCGALWKKLSTIWEEEKEITSTFSKIAVNSQQQNETMIKEPTSEVAFVPEQPTAAGKVKEVATGAIKKELKTIHKKETHRSGNNVPSSSEKPTGATIGNPRSRSSLKPEQPSAAGGTFDTEGKVGAPKKKVSFACEDKDITERKVKYLLYAIERELHGEVEPEQDTYLERELARYKEALLQHSDFADEIKKCKGKRSLRCYLLFQFQDGLRKMLKPECPEARASQEI